MTHSRKQKFAIVATHPVQYHVPWFDALASHERVVLKVFYYTSLISRKQRVDFGVPFQWDIPLLDGYQWEALKKPDGRTHGSGSIPETFLGLMKKLRTGDFDAVTRQAGMRCLSCKPYGLASN